MRPELIHPLIVHFPLALLLTGVALRFIHFLLRNSRFARVTLFSSWILLSIGVCFAWIAVAAGEVAADIVSKGLCKPDVFEQHQDFAYTASTLFSIALFIDLVKTWGRISFFNSTALSLIMALIYISATAMLILAGGYGANLVYEQGAAVKKSCG